MAKRHQIDQKQQLEIEAARKKNKNKNVEKRLRALLLHAEGKKHADIALQTGFAPSYISELVSKYIHKGLAGITENNHSGNHRNLSYAEEEELLMPFVEKAKKGQMIEISEIKRAYEEAIGRSLENSRGQIYYVLRRHGWRKVMPRSKHPNKASDEVIEASKKLTQSSEARWIIMPQEILD